MEIAGYAASVLIGISLGLMGGGGSILTVPVLVYLFRVDAVTATAYSLFIVGTTSLLGALSYFRKGLVELRTAVIFGIPSVATVFLTRTYLLPAIPQKIFSTGSFVVTKNSFLMLLFAVLMILAAYSMIKKNKKHHNAAAPQQRTGYLLAQGAGVGLVTGLVGAGGGFLIIPALVNFLKMPVKKAIGTSLVIISINSLTGFLFSLQHTLIHWSFLLSITALAVAGILIGSYLAAKIDGKKLKPAFGWFVLAMGLYIILKEMLTK